MEASRSLGSQHRPLTDTERAVARSVLFAALFDYPLTLGQLRQTLIEQPMTASEIRILYQKSEALQRLIDFDQSLFFPSGAHWLIAERRRREMRSRRFLDRHQLFLRLVCALPYVRMVALSGSVAHRNLDGRGDLDLFIVTRGPRVWSVTVTIVCLAKLLRRRATVCANFAVSDRRLAFPNGDLFTASQIIHLKPLIGAEVFTRILESNPFVSQYYPNFHPAGARLLAHRQGRMVRVIKRACEAVGYYPSALAERICRAAYRTYLRRRSATWSSPDQVRLDDDYLKLHTQSHRRSVLTRFESAMRDLERQI